MIFESLIGSQGASNAKYEAKGKSIDTNDFEELRDSSLSTSSILETTIFASSQSQSIREPLFEDQLQQREEEFEDELVELNIIASASFATFATSAAFARKTRGKASSSPPSDRKTRTQEGKLAKLDYAKLHDPKKVKSIINNVYKAKQMSKSHIHMMRALNALTSDESFDLEHTFESMNYKKARRSSL